MHQGYVLKLPNKFLQQHGGKIRDGLTVLKCMAAIGKCAGLPLSLEGMPRNVVSMAIRLGRRSRQWPLTLAATYLTLAAAVATSGSDCVLLASGLSPRCRSDALTLTGRGQGRKVVRRAAQQRRLRRGLPGSAHHRRELAHLIGDGQGLPGAEGIGEGRSSKERVAYANKLFECASLLFCAGGGPVRGPKPDAVRPGEVRGRRRQRRVGVSPQQGAPRLSLSLSPLFAR